MKYLDDGTNTMGQGSLATRHASNTDFEEQLSPAFEKALEKLNDIDISTLKPQDIQIISETARNVAPLKAYRMIHPGAPHMDSRKFFKRDDVRRAVAQLRKHHLMYTEIDYNQKMSMLWDIANFCTGKMFDVEGNEIMKNPAAAKAAISEMNKMSGDIAPEKKEVTIKQAELSEEELLEKISGLTKILDLEDSQYEILGQEAKEIKPLGPSDPPDGA